MFSYSLGQDPKDGIYLREMGHQHFYTKTGIIGSKIANSHMNQKKYSQ